MNTHKPSQLHLEIPSPRKMLAFAHELARHVPACATLFLQGPMGAGKTTFARGFLYGLGYQGKVKSPTYALVEPYEIQDKAIFHFDFYRLKDPTELTGIGIHDYFANNAIFLIEWPENGLPLLPKPDLICVIAFSDGGRKINLSAESHIGLEILGCLR